jgi:ferredoxin
LAVGRLAGATGALAGFSVVVDGYAPLVASGRGAGRFGTPVNGAKSRCDVILDLRGGTPLFPAPDKREGYLRADPRDPAAVERAVFRAADLQGTFEKPLYIRYDAAICAHSRASQKGCDRCLDVCPTGAILPDGDGVKIDPDICAGCGACAAVCPSGAASYDDPGVGFLFTRLRTLSAAFRAAGGVAPRVLFHDAGHGAEMIRLSARFGRGLPADVIPVEVANVEGVGHAELLAAFGVGFAAAHVLIGPRTDPAVPEREIALAQAILSGAGGLEGRVSALAPADPDALEAALFGSAAPALRHETILPMGARREVTRLAASALAGGEMPVIGLPQGAPYGAVAIDTGACTLCLACVSLCPVGALADNPDKPQVRFQETACLQCGICANTCPETAITLVPQLNLGNDALSHRVLHEEEPFECITCGKPFGTKSTI